MPLQTYKFLEAKRIDQTNDKQKLTYASRRYAFNLAVKFVYASDDDAAEYDVCRAVTMACGTVLLVHECTNVPGYQ